MECLFCKIVAGEIPSQKVYEDENHLAFLDINPRNPGHTLVIPKKHYETIMNMPDEEAGRLFQTVKRLAAAIKKAMNADGISIAQSNERAAGQVIPHVHFHVIPRFLSEGPPGLESILPPKKLTQEIMEKTREAIEKGVSNLNTSVNEKKSSEKEMDFNF
ncbi:MAG: HIT family protein [Candidatus Aenigmarchaeota archaeon]|nr:HIT family protein [Candidatus Aenigmarchaeota archaeon]